MSDCIMRRIFGSVMILFGSEHLHMIPQEYSE